ELWEVLRISSWRRVERHVCLMREGDADQRFGVVLEGSVELSIEGRRVMELGAGEVFGVQAWLDSLEHRHMMSVVSLSALTYLEINPAALALASEEVLERFRRELATMVVRRLAQTARQLSVGAPAAVRGDYTATGGLDLQLLEP
nr:Crp/Fnr family transcriptional regulator [Thauera sp.]